MEFLSGSIFTCSNFIFINSIINIIEFSTDLLLLHHWQSWGLITAKWDEMKID